MIFLFNGPPGSGKGEACNYMARVYPWYVKKMSFKTKLVELTQLLYNVSPELWDDWYTREGKEMSRKELNGLSCRQALIHISEDIIKPNFGKDYWGKALMNNLPTNNTTDVFIDDAGFVEEVTPIIDKVGQDNVVLIHIHREGCSFKGDSRSWIPDDMFKNYYVINNDGDLPALYEKIKDLWHTYKMYP